MSSKKQELLLQIEKVVLSCHSCRLWRGTNHAVPGEGSATAAVMFVGEGPGYHEDRLGRPFVGRAGSILDRLLEKNRLSRSQVFITNVVKHRPPQNRAPMKDEVRACLPYLLQQIKIVNPKIIVVLGRSALEIFNKEKTITESHGHPYRVGNRIILPLYHPAAALRSTLVMRTLERDFKILPQLIKGEIKVSEVELKKGDENQLKLI